MATAPHSETTSQATLGEILSGRVIALLEQS